MDEHQEWDEYLADRDMAMWRELADVQSLFRYVITVPGSSTYYCRDITEDDMGDRTRLRLDDVWVQDASMKTRLVPVVVLVVREWEQVSLPQSEL